MFEVKKITFTLLTIHAWEGIMILFDQIAFSSCLFTCYDLNFVHQLALRYIISSDNKLITEGKQTIFENNPRLQFQINVVDFIRKRCGLSDRFSEEDVLHVIGILRTNAFHIENPRMKKQGVSGRGVFPTFSFLSHSCVCNARYRYRRRRTDCRKWDMTFMQRRSIFIICFCINELTTSYVRIQSKENYENTIFVPFFYHWFFHGNFTILIKAKEAERTYVCNLKKKESIPKALYYP